MAAVGLLGGTFNPPHLGHLALALHARDELAVERVELVPAGSPPHKQDAADPGVGHRLTMCGLLAGEADGGVLVNAIETARAGPSFTVDTLAALHASSPDDEIWFILGADTARTIAGWRDPRGVLELCGLAVAGRPGATLEAARAAVSGVDAGAAERLRVIDMPPVELSSSQIRERAAAGLPVGDQTGAAVAGYIERHALYGRH